ncbi:flagellar basal-body rod protein FlgF [Asticcacaulis sp. YBE204]|uniref:flagellar basal-body rod protein FlgF n=1 Tax=Asticcacaulis sp. YBE204 TaxID=1282363 RepID=UPI0003C3EB8F|nr:flagellar basal-body rod protein FlgF [Asticcacaulis sp. YBE204]ESQ80140.1 flagellar basal-body rod protein FlgF [Asticcacaulis sp. YBE204]
MDNATYVALSRQLVLRRELDVTANNLANMNTSGYKFEQLLVETEPGKPAYNLPIRAPANFAFDKGIGRDFSQGSFIQTGSDYDLAIEGEGAFFVVNGPSGPLYTRDGAFTVNSEGVLTTQEGLPVQGDGGEIRLNAEFGAPSISADGIVSQRSADGTVRVGKINVVRFANLSDVEKRGDNMFAATSNATPDPAGDVRIRQGMLEASNVNALTEVTRLVEINRSYASISKVIDQNQELNRNAIERLGRVA